MSRIAKLVLAAMIVLVSVSIGPAMGGAEPFDDVESIGSRQLYVDKDTFFASISSFSDSKGAPWFKFSMDAHDELGIKASYGFNDRTRDYVGMDLKFIALIEYFDSNGNGVYDEKEERIASFYPLSISAYSTDFLNRERVWNDTKVSDETEIIRNGTWDVDYSEAYQMGFLWGWDIGMISGYEDRASALPFLPDPARRIPSEMERARISFDQKLSSKNAYPADIRAWLLDGAVGAFQAGFKNGYSTAYYSKPSSNSTADESGTKTSDSSSSADPTSDRPDPSSKANVTTPDSQMEDGASTPHSNSTSSGSNGTKTVSSTYTGVSSSEASGSGTGSGTRGGYAKPDPASMARPAQNIVPKYRPLNISRSNTDGKDRVKLETWDNNGFFGIRCVVSNEFSVVENGYLSPASIKIDMMIGNYPYKANGTKIALLMEMGSDVNYAGEVDMEKRAESYDQEAGLASDEEEVSFAASDFSGFLSWIKDAEADGKVAPVKSRVLDSVYGKYWEDLGGSSENHRGVLFCYPRAERIVHDNKLGFVEIEKTNVYASFPDEPIPSKARSISGDPFLYAGGIAVIVVLVAFTWKRRGPSK